MNILSKIKTVLLLATFVTVFSTGLLFLHQTTKAAFLGIPFGGFVSGVFPCSCSGSMILTLSPGFEGPIPSVLPLMYVPGTQAYAWWNMGTPGIWSLGMEGGPWACFIPTVSPPCTNIFDGPLIEPIVGSSPF